MRIHQLTLSAFGPFAGTQVVDFEELNDAGVFLVTGATGAGKTSILDAVCFALFGQVPGERGVKALRSDHAGPDARPEVVLDVTLAGRRFVIRRAPEWQRPKRRGHGTTTEKASASLLEIVDGTEHLVSARAQEVGHFLSDLLGMTAGQFQQVALLPQGEFQTFLRATSQERHDVLQQLFHTERFTRIEQWVQDRSRRLRDRAAQGEASVRRLVDTMADRSGAEVPPSLQGDALARAASANQVLPWAQAVVARSTTDLTDARAAHDAATATRLEVQKAHDETARLHLVRARRDSATRALAALADDSSAAAGRARLEIAARAAHCAPLLRLLDASLRAREAAERAHAAVAVPGLTDPGHELESATARLARLQALLPRERELRHVREAIETGEAALARLRAELALTAARASALPTRRAELSRAIDEAERGVRERVLLERSVAGAEARLTAAASLPGAEQTLADCQHQAAEARDAAADARERLLDVITRRLAGMAAELAGTLTDGRPCQVCGSLDHPAPAASSTGAVDEADQLAATAEAEALRTIHEATLARVQEAELAASTLRHQTGGLSQDAAAAEALLQREALDAATAAEAALEQLKAALASLDESELEVTERARALLDEVARLDASVATSTATADRLVAELADELDDAESVATAIERLQRRAAALRALAGAAVVLAQAEADLARLQEAAVASAADHGFAGLDEVRTALLGDDDREGLARELHAYDEALAEARRVLADPELADLPADLPDPVAARQALDASKATESDAARTHHLCHERAEALAVQVERLQGALTGWAPAREEFLTADSMSRLVRGMGGDNQLQLRLSSYVLATRLDQVLAAANERLGHMREQRYHLERIGDATRKGSQAGLGLRVVDEWTGESRAPATLSGGETFVVSLALALGLSDVVSAESGGVELGTLFIDEGFGMLDLDTLDDVMDRLDGLRAGGRTVGVVSHVSELRNRIPTQLYVEKHRAGSSVRVTTLIA